MIKHLTILYSVFFVYILFKIRIFGNYIFKQISKLTKTYLFSKGWVWEKIVEKEIYCAHLAQLSRTFVFEIHIFENYMLIQISKLTKKYLFIKGCVWEKIVKEEIYRARLVQLSAIFIFSKFAFLKMICLYKFRNRQKSIYFQKDASERKLLFCFVKKTKWQ